MRAVGMAEDVPLLRPATAAVAVLMQSFNADRSHRPEMQSRPVRLEWLERYREEITLFAQAIGCAPRPTYHLFQRGGVMAVGLETFRYQPSMAAEFWHGMAADDGLKVGDPRKTLLRLLQVNKVAATGASTNVQARACALAWNAAFKRRDLTLLKPNTMGLINILGTPWDGRPPDDATPAPAPAPRPPAGNGGADLFGAGA
jgi:hypothetical protein